jgi:hypothetical protein
MAPKINRFLKKTYFQKTFLGRSTSSVAQSTPRRVLLLRKITKQKTEFIGASLCSILFINNFPFCGKPGKTILLPNYCIFTAN